MTDIETARSLYKDLPACGMSKQAASPIAFIAGGINSLKSLTLSGASLLLAGAAAAGAGTGWIASQLTADRKAEAATAKKEYDDERLTADIGYLQGRVREEAAARIHRKGAKPARILNA